MLNGALDKRSAELSQEWLTRRLATIEPQDFEDGVHMYCTAQMRPPKNFAQVWTVYDGSGMSLPQNACDISALSTIIIFSNPVDDVQVEKLCKLVQAIDNLGHSAPPILWVPHTCAPSSGGDRWQVDVADEERGGIVSHLLSLGLDAVVAGEPEGARLALAVRSKIHKLEQLSGTLNDVVNERRSRAGYANYLKECVQAMLWDYLRVRLAPAIPPIDYDIGPDEQKHLDGWVFGSLLGKGLFGSVYKLTPEDDPQRSSSPSDLQVIKVVSKSSVKDLAEFSAMRRQIEVMVMLSDKWQHPNLVNLYQTYHSSTHLYFRMEFGGPENLYRRLNHRQKDGPQQRPLPLVKVVILLRQAIQVVTHLHLGPRVCHRDLKPENIIVRDTSNAPFSIKLADFDLAALQTGNQVCRSPCGTVPFTAPEVLLQREYKGMAADIWSLGIVFLEVLCGVRVVEQLLALAETKASRSGEDSIGHKIRSRFLEKDSPGKVIQERCRTELQQLVQTMKVILNGMIKVDTKQRWDAEQLKKSLLSLDALPLR